MQDRAKHPGSGQRLRTGIELALALLLVASLTLVLQSRWNPAVEPMRPDSGLFAYGGQQILAGRTLYQDVWDHKPPAIYFLNALAFTIGGETSWTLWSLSAITVMVSAALVLLSLYLVTGLWPSLIATGFFLFTLHHPNYYEGGNLTELYALVPNAAILLALAVYLGRAGAWFPIVVGALTALALLFKPSLISVGLVALGVGAWHHRNLEGGLRPQRTILLAGIAAAAILLPVGIFFASQGTLGAMLEAVFSANVSYSGQTLSLRSLYGTARKLLVEQPIASLMGLAFLSAPIALLPLLQRIRTGNVDSIDHGMPDSQQRKAWQAFHVAVLAAMPLQIIAAAATGRNFGHYFLDVILTLSISAGLLFQFVRVRTRDPWRVSVSAVSLFFVMSWALSTATAVTPTVDTLRELRGNWRQRSIVEPAVYAYLQSNASEGDVLLVWSIHPSIYFLTGQVAPSPYIQANQLLEPSQGGQQRFDAFMQDLGETPPKFIVAQPQSSAGIPYFAAPQEAFCPGCDPVIRERMVRLQEFVGLRYEKRAEVADWVIFGLKQ